MSIVILETDSCVMMDFHRHIYLIVKQASKHIYYIRYDAKALKLSKMTRKAMKELKNIPRSPEALAQRWLDKESEGVAIGVTAKEALQLIAIPPTTARLC